MTVQRTQSRDLNLADLQGNIVRAYGGYGYARARYFFLNISDGDKGRAFVDVIRQKVTTAERWDQGSNNHPDGDFLPRPPVTLNITFTFWGLLALGLPTRTLRELPDEFIDGMAKRRDMLGDVNASGPEHWDPVWRHAGLGGTADDMHMMISMNASIDDTTGAAVPELEEQTQWLRDLCASNGGVKILPGNGPDGADYQDAAAKLVDGPDGKKQMTGKEHFGYTDGLGNPVFAGQYPPEIEKIKVIGRGKITPDQKWAPIAPGEFIIGLADESQGLPPASKPWEFTQNGTFMVYRKLHQNTKSFADYVDKMADQYAQVMGVDKTEASFTIKAKLVGRWPDGVPLMKAPTYKDWEAFNAKWKSEQQELEKKGDIAGLKALKTAFEIELMDWKFADDLDGIKCPVSAHMRRANTRDMLDPNITSPNMSSHSGSSLNKRRRILRRGLPYGTFDPDSPDDGDHGIIFIVVCTSIFRQFEFVQQQWIQYGLDFNVGNDTCPILGNHDERSKFVIAADPASGNPPFVCPAMPQFVTTKGGDYFFLPSMTALQMIAMGSVDPT